MANCLCEDCARGVAAGLPLCDTCQRGTALSFGFCGDGICATRVSFWLQMPYDAVISDPCDTCLLALSAVLGVDRQGGTPLTLRGFHAALAAEGRLP